VKKVDDKTVQFVLTRPESPFLADLAMDFASILSKEYADNMLKAGTPEKVDLNPIGTGPFQLLQYQKDSRILYKAFPGYWGTKPKSIAWSSPSPLMLPCATLSCRKTNARLCRTRTRQTSRA
jgi:dipeptide transport system substrate-binding protein